MEPSPGLSTTLSMPPREAGLGATGEKPVRVSVLGWLSRDLVLNSKLVSDLGPLT